MFVSCADVVHVMRISFLLRNVVASNGRLWTALMPSISQVFHCDHNNTNASDGCEQDGDTVHLQLEHELTAARRQHPDVDALACLHRVSLFRNQVAVLRFRSFVL